MQTYTHVFAVLKGGKPGSGLIDGVHPQTGRGIYSGDTLEQIQQREPGAEVIAYGDWHRAMVAMYLGLLPMPITEEKYHEMLDCLPPSHWRRAKGSSSFQMVEHQWDQVTTAFVRVGDLYFECYVIAGTPHAEIVARCNAVKS